LKYNKALLTIIQVELYMQQNLILYNIKAYGIYIMLSTRES